jgi:hypothetical protein
MSNCSWPGMRVSIEETNIVLVDEFTLREALHWVSGCGACSGYAAISFDYILDALTGWDPSTTEYVLCRPGKCPECSAAITEKTAVAVC